MGRFALEESQRDMNVCSRNGIRAVHDIIIGMGIARIFEIGNQQSRLACPCQALNPNPYKVKPNP